MLLSATSPYIDVLFWLAVACCAVAQGAIVRSVLRAGAGEHPPHEPAPHEASERRLPQSRRVVELVWVLIPALGLAAVLVATWHRMHPRI